MLHPGLSLQGGRYRLLSLLRRGATASVWRALDAREGVEVAVKALPVEAGGADAAELEAEAAARVRHPGVVRVHGAFDEVEHGFVVMELARANLHDVLERHGPLDGSTTRAVAAALADVLAATHAAGVVHRDIKPQNVLVMDDGSVRLADFGIARVHARGHTRTGALLGTLPFMAPEQRRDARDVRPATDVYAWAVLVAWMRTGTMPGELYVPAAIEGLRARLEAVGEQDGELLGLLTGCGAYAPEERIADGAELVERVRGWRAEVRLVGVPAESRATAEPRAVDASTRLPLTDTAQRVHATVERSRAPQTAASLAVIVAVGVAAYAARPHPEAKPITPPGTAEEGGTEPTQTATACDVGVRRLLPVVRMAPEETIAAGAFDLDGDGLPEAIYTNQLAETLSIWWGTRRGVLVDSLQIQSGRSAGAATLYAERDSRVLLLPLTDASRIRRWAVHGRTLTPLSDIEQPGSPTDLAVVHWDDDEALDLLVNTTPCLMFRKGDGTGAFQTGTCVAMRPYSRVFGSVVEGTRTLAALADGNRSFLATGEADGAPRTLRPLPSRTLPASDGNIYSWALTEAGTTVVRWSRDAGSAEFGAPCTWATGQTDASAVHAVADLDGDGFVEVLGSRTCAGCTSNQVVWTAQAATDGPTVRTPP